MATPPEMQKLLQEHAPPAVASRLAGARSSSLLGDAVLGAIDGGVTTFAVVAGTAGAGFPRPVALVMGLANLAADGFSMAVSNYQAIQSRREELERARRTEEKHIRLVPEGEREEVRQIFRQKGFQGKDLETVVEVITSDEKRWVDTMLREEWGLSLEAGHPLRGSLATFGAFLAVGLVPLLPFFFGAGDGRGLFGYSTLLTGVAFFLIGVGKGRVLGRPALRSGLGTLLLGGAAAGLSYAVARWLRATFGL